ncbi:hypothetical protein [Mucilaginibacter sp. 10I4]|uniref:hypothetical protein n=1 Tax=Mucilaginibacter sp. 10I4 TaxID=3048580 RepID=UPI002B22773E|nr:hypothetical protein [Mucilaginibacter sp. 10I4]MEB0262893.1 hypothetical protein [Mucilaginibacter sp. 10I4]
MKLLIILSICTILYGCHKASEVQIIPIDTLHSSIDSYEISELKFEETYSHIEDGVETVLKYMALKNQMQELKVKYYETKNEKYRLRYNSLVSELKILKAKLKPYTSLPIDTNKAL